MSSRGAAVAVEGSKVAVTVVADATVKGATVAVAGGQYATRKIATVSSRGLDAAVSGSKRRLTELGDLSSRGAAVAVEGSKVAATVVADATVKGATVAVAGGQYATRKIATVSSRGLDAAVSGSKRRLTELGDLSSRGAAVAVEGSKVAATIVADATVKGATVAVAGGQYATRKIADVSSRGLDAAAEGSKKALDQARISAVDLLSVSQGALASALAADLNALLAKISEGPATIYDRAMDADYLATYVGGGSHRLFDGGHTLGGAFERVRGASSDDSIMQEGLGYVQGLFRDLTTSKGLPLANWDKGTYDQVSGHLQSHWHIPRDWFYDLNSFDAAELVGGAVGVLAVGFCWKRTDAEQFARLVGGMGISATISANPLLLIVTVAATALAFRKAQLEGQHAEAVDGLVRGTITAGSALATATAVAAFGGPSGLALLVALVAAVLASKVAGKVCIVEVGRYVAQCAKATAKFVDQSVPRAPAVGVP